jgi:hypothetical protein
MKKFMLFYVGMADHTPEVMDGWTKWFGVLGSRVVDSGNPFGPGQEMTREGVTELPQDAHATVGYTIINAESMDEVMELAKQCPIVTGLRIYEAIPM